jgi:hypothetical protein
VSTPDLNEIEVRQMLELRQLLADQQAQLERGVSVITALLQNIGEGARCTLCQSKIVKVRHRNGLLTPYDPDGIKHTITCPRASELKKKKETTRGR